MTPKSVPAVAPRRLRLIGIIVAVAAIGLAVYGIADRAPELPGRRARSSGGKTSMF